MKLNIVGASNFVNRMFEACGKYQWAREFTMNSIEAGATHLEFGIEWQAVAKHGIYRRVVADDGCGMDRAELLRFFSTLGEGAKQIGGIHDNFGVGAKIASLPWNPEGVVVISYKAGQAAMIWIVLNPESAEYELSEFVTEDGKHHVIDPTEFEWDDIEWDKVRPDWLREHGTVIVLLGSRDSPDTVLGNPDAGENDIKGLSVYLNSRFWKLDSLDVRVVELRSDKKNQWPQGQDDRDDARRPNNRRIQGARFYLTDVTASQGRLGAADNIMLDEDRVVAEWYLWEGERPAIHSYARKPGYIAVRYNNELYELTSGKVDFRHFAIIESKVQQNLTIILEPTHYDRLKFPWGVHPDQSRNRMVFTGHGEKATAIPLADWGREFADNIPEPILAAIRAAKGERSGTIEDEEYRKRLQDKFGNRWTMKVLVEAKKKAQQEDAPPPSPVAITAEEVNVVNEPKPFGPDRRRKRKAVKVLRKKGLPEGAEQGVEAEVVVDVPRYEFAHKEDFSHPWHLAMWVPHDPEGPTVYINIDSPIMEEAVKYHREQYPLAIAEEVGDEVRKVFGEVAACKVAHSQKLTREIAEEELDRTYRSEAALTVALMGLISEESLIAQRLGRYGRKRMATAKDTERVSG